MTLYEYKDKAITTLKYPGSREELGLRYVSLGLAGECGEIAEKLKKIIRDQSCEITPSQKEDLIKEVGDVLWYIFGMQYELDSYITDGTFSDIEEVATQGLIDHLKLPKEEDIKPHEWEGAFLEVTTQAIIASAFVGGIQIEIHPLIHTPDDYEKVNARKAILQILEKVLFSLASITILLGVCSFEEAAQRNLDKLFSRKDRGVISGSGDDR